MITVIVPVYNVENYIKKCVESILNQTYRELEIILVNDGSTDNSSVVCDEFKTIDNRVKVIHKKNGGLSDARNAGLAIASGDYITFVDSDDYIATDMYRVMIDAMRRNEAEIGVCGIGYITNGVSSEISCLPTEKVYREKEALCTYFSTNDLNASVCNKLFKRSLFEGICFPLHKKFEDTFIIHRVIERAGVVVHVGKPLYYYVNRGGSITKRPFSVKDMDLLEAKREIYMRYMADLSLRTYVECNYFEAYLITLDKIIYYNCVDEYSSEFNECVSFIRKNILRVLANNSMSIKNKVKIILIKVAIPFYCKLIARNNRGIIEDEK